MNKREQKKLIIWFLSVVVMISAISLSKISVYAETNQKVTVKFKLTLGQTEARDMLNMVNEFRIGTDAWYWNTDDTTKTECIGLNALEYDYNLEKIATQRAMEIAVSYAHIRPNGENCFSLFDSEYGYKGENIAVGYQTAEDVFEGWQETDEKYSGQGHRRNMLSSNFKAIGIGHVYYNGYHYWVQELGDKNLQPQKTEAVDTEVMASVEIMASDIVDSSILAKPENVSVKIGENVDIPVIQAKIKNAKTWLNREIPVFIDADWSVQNTDYAEISGKSILGKAMGTTELIAIIPSLEKNIIVPLTIKSFHVSNITLDKNEVSLLVGETMELKATIESEDELNKNIIWSSSNEDIATISKEGIITALASGNVIITAITEDGGKEASCKVTVKENERKLGDVDNSGDIDVNDALIILKISASLITPTQAQEKIADVNGDNTIDSADALLVLKYAAGLITGFSNS